MKKESKTFRGGNLKNRFNEELQKFKRSLQTNYKYSCLVTLTMRMVRSHGVNSTCIKVSKSCGIKEQKNYGIIALRLSILLYHKIADKQIQRSLAIKEVFDYLENNFEDCLKKKYKKLISNSKQPQLQLVKDKFNNDVEAFKKAFIHFQGNQQQTARILTELYRIKSHGEPSRKQWKQAFRLSKIICGVAESGENYQCSQQTSEKVKVQIQCNQEKIIEQSSKQAEVKQQVGVEQPLIKFETFNQPKIISCFEENKLFSQNQTKLFESQSTHLRMPAFDYKNLIYYPSQMFIAPSFLPWGFCNW